MFEPFFPTKAEINEQYKGSFEYEELKKRMNNLDNRVSTLEKRVDEFSTKFKAWLASKDNKSKGKTQVRPTKTAQIAKKSMKA